MPVVVIAILVGVSLIASILIEQSKYVTGTSWENSTWRLHSLSYARIENNVFKATAWNESGEGFGAALIQQGDNPHSWWNSTARLAKEITVNKEQEQSLVLDFVGKRTSQIEWFTDNQSNRGNNIGILLVGDVGLGYYNSDNSTPRALYIDIWLDTNPISGIWHWQGVEDVENDYHSGFPVETMPEVEKEYEFKFGVDQFIRKSLDHWNLTSFTLKMVQCYIEAKASRGSMEASRVLISTPCMQIPRSKVYDPHIDGFGWYLSGWNLDAGAEWKRENKDSVFYGYIKDLDGQTIRSVSIIQGYNPHQWPIQYEEGNGEDKLLEEGIPRKLIVKVKRGNYNFHLKPNETFANKCWVAIGIDMRFSIKGKDYDDAMGEEGADSLVIGIPLFEVHLYQNPDESLREEVKQINEVVLRTHNMPWGDGSEILYHYSKVKAVLPKDQWIMLEIDLCDVIMESQCAFGIIIDKQHQIQLFIESCGGSIEAWIDYVSLE